jgi:hypothetical protein
MTVEYRTLFNMNVVPNISSKQLVWYTELNNHGLLAGVWWPDIFLEELIEADTPA